MWPRVEFPYSVDRKGVAPVRSHDSQSSGPSQKPGLVGEARDNTRGKERERGIRERESAGN